MVSSALRQAKRTVLSMTALSESPPSYRFAEPTPSKSAAHSLRQATQATLHGYRWKRFHGARVLLIDTIAVVTAVVLASIGRFGLPDDDPPHVGYTWPGGAISPLSPRVICLT